MFPAVTVTDAGVAETEKSVIFNVTVALCVPPAEVPVIVTV